MVSKRNTSKILCSILRVPCIDKREYIWYSEKQLVLMAVRTHLYPYRTQKLSSPASKILGWRRPGKIERCQHKRKRTGETVRFVYSSLARAQIKLRLLSEEHTSKSPYKSSFLTVCTGTALSSQAVSSQVFSTLVSLTSVFGMGTGGTSPPLAPVLRTGSSKLNKET